jgi:hypothetical protein
VQLGFDGAQMRKGLLKLRRLAPHRILGVYDLRVQPS